MSKKIVAGDLVFIDATIFIYHFTGASEECRDLLAQCESGKIKGVSSVVVMAEVAHRLMMIEAIVKGIVTRGNLTRKLAGKSAAIKTLTVYQAQVDRIPLMGIRIESMDLSLVLRSAELRRRYGLMINDSLVATSAIDSQVDVFATADADFDRVQEFSVFHPEDVEIL